MDVKDKTVVVTGAAGGIGRAIAERFAAEGARLALCDLDGAGARDVAKSLSAAASAAWGAGVDVGDEGALVSFLNAAERRLGPVQLFIANAGVGVTDGPGWGAASAPNAAWDLCWRVNVMQSVWAARALLPGLAQRGGGFVIVASSAGLLTMIGDAAYSATKHAAVAFAESLAITHGDDGLQVVCVVPEGVRTNMTKGLENSVLAMSGFKEPADVANALAEALAQKRHFAFTHDNSHAFAQARLADPDRWLGSMRKVRREIITKHGRPM